MIEVAATEFAKRFAQYRRAAQREPVGVTHHGQTTEVLLSLAHFEEYQALKRRLPRAYWAWELPGEWLEALAPGAPESEIDGPDAK